MANLSSLVVALVASVAVILVPVVLLVILINVRSWAEALIALFVVLALAFYYSPHLVLWLQGIPGTLPSFLIGPAASSANVLNGYHIWVQDHILSFRGFSFFGITLLRIDQNSNPAISGWPIAILYFGALIRLVIYRFVRNEQVRQVGRGYWLFITAYFVLAVIVSDLTTWSFISLVLVFLAIIVLVLANVFTVVGDALQGVLNIVKLFGNVIRLGLKLLALGGTEVAKFIRRVVSRVRELYIRYVRKPMRGAYDRAANLQGRAEKAVTRKLDNERIDPGS